MMLMLRVGYSIGGALAVGALVNGALQAAKVADVVGLLFGSAAGMAMFLILAAITVWPKIGDW